jgi:hypothetical protein
MARKRKPLVVNDETVELDAPGLQITQRPNGAGSSVEWRAQYLADGQGDLVVERSFRLCSARNYRFYGFPAILRRASKRRM